MIISYARWNWSEQAYLYGHKQWAFYRHSIKLGLTYFFFKTEVLKLSCTVVPVNFRKKKSNAPSLFKKC